MSIPLYEILENIDRLQKRYPDKDVQLETKNLRWEFALTIDNEPNTEE